MLRQKCEVINIFLNFIVNVKKCIKIVYKLARVLAGKQKKPIHFTKHLDASEEE